ncbi:MAG: hypothetical protein AB8G95_01025 [Anaerolineae bacterium]
MILLPIIFLFACSSLGLGFEDFQEQVLSTAVDQAVDCGWVKVLDSPESVNQCVIDSFVAGNPFFAIYELQGIDSYPAVALVSNGAGDLIRMNFDSDPTGSGQRHNGRIDSYMCTNPKLIGTIDDFVDDLFLCA